VALRERHQTLFEIGRAAGSTDTTLEQMWDTLVGERNALRQAHASANPPHAESDGFK
jgi:hypothetical protein